MGERAGEAIPTQVEQRTDAAQVVQAAVIENPRPRVRCHYLGDDNVVIARFDIAKDATFHMRDALLDDRRAHDAR